MCNCVTLHCLNVPKTPMFSSLHYLPPRSLTISWYFEALSAVAILTHSVLIGAEVQYGAQNSAFLWSNCETKNRFGGWNFHPKNLGR